MTPSEAEMGPDGSPQGGPQVAPAVRRTGAPLALASEAGMRRRVVILGMGDTGLLTAVRLRRVADLTVVAPRGGMVSGQELGLRLAQPDTWLSTSLFPADRYPALAAAQVLHGRATAVDADAQTVTVRLAGGRTTVQPYDVLVIATGTTSGFWRSGRIEDLATVEARGRPAAARRRGGSGARPGRGGAA